MTVTVERSTTIIHTCVGCSDTYSETSNNVEDPPQKLPPGWITVQGNVAAISKGDYCGGCERAMALAVAEQARRVSA